MRGACQCRILKSCVLIPALTKIVDRGSLDTVLHEIFVSVAKCEQAVDCQRVYQERFENMILKGLE